MIPDGLGGLVAVLVFIAPGSAYEAVLHKARPALRASAFREANRVVLVSLAAWVLPAAAWLIPSIWAAPWFGDRVIGLLDGSVAASTDPTAAVLLTATAGAAVGLAASAALWSGRGVTSTIRNETAWDVALHQMRQDDRPYLWVTMDDDTVWGGHYKVGDVRDVPMEKRDLLLGGSLKVRHPGEQEARLYRAGHVLVLNGASIKSISVTYLKS